MFFYNRRRRKFVERTTQQNYILRETYVIKEKRAEWFASDYATFVANRRMRCYVHSWFLSVASKGRFNWYKGKKRHIHDM